MTNPDGSIGNGLGSSLRGLIVGLGAPAAVVALVAWLLFQNLPQIGSGKGSSAPVECGQPTTTAPRGETVANFAAKVCGQQLKALKPTNLPQSCRGQTDYCFASLKGQKGVYAVVPVHSGKANPADVPSSFAQRDGPGNDWMVVFSGNRRLLLKMPSGAVKLTLPGNLLAWSWSGTTWKTEPDPQVPDLSVRREAFDAFLDT
ncbi:MAG TPA: hypothetical protein VMT30_05365 [Candidatus Saccharimonadia bacterium]|nr:hypothetical protein [Candidatus Saccharimonadia bacterium]